MRTVEIKTNGNSYLVVDLDCDKGSKVFQDSFGIHYESRGLPTFLNLPFAFETIGFASSLSEKEWAGIVEKFCIYKPFYFDYTNKLNHYWTATKSGKSWLEANGIADFVNPFLLIKK